jgi:hypothetical protein
MEFVSRAVLWPRARSQPCESAFRPAGTLEVAYSINWRDAIENIIDIDPVAALVREIMQDRAQWTGSASDLCSRHQAVRLAQESSRTRWAAAAGTDLPAHPGY